MAKVRSLRRAMQLVALATVALFVGIQLVPHGRDHSSPPVVKEPPWNQPATRALAVRACFDCHSNETRWPWYSHIAPISWLVQRDVDEGRREVNFSEWQRTYKEASESASSVLEGGMPPRSYIALHPSARLTSDEKQALARGLSATLGSAAGSVERNDD